ncbi:MAG: DUF2497 domain-containing protein [Xanthobacteraceae bacterium]|nr:MAG: DUF2497 domain-containing protein [Xanthobacteraceae bacterium]
MTQPAKAQEPSMEEILASIRRIIADDEAKPAAAPPAASSAASRPDAAKPDSRPNRAAEAPRAAGPAKAPEPAKAAPVAAAKAAAPAADAEPNNQDDIDALLAGLDTVDAKPGDAATADLDADADILDLTESMAVPEQSAFRRIEPHNDLEFAEDDMAAAMTAMKTPAAAGAAAPLPAPSFEPEPPSAPERPLLSTTTIAAVDSAFNSLAHTVLSQNARTLEDLVREMLRPMLKSWLDDNLPGLVERLVKAEIERVARGR